MLNNIDLQILLPMINLGMFFILIATRAYKTSYSTAVIVSFTTLVSFINRTHLNMDTWAPATAVVGFLLLRAIVNHEEDAWIKR